MYIYSGLLYKEYNSCNYFTQRHVYFIYDTLRIYYKYGSCSYNIFANKFFFY